MKKILATLAILLPLVASAQRMEVYVYNNYNYLSLYAYGLPRDVVKTNAEMRASLSNGDGTGVMLRHHTSKGVDQPITSEGYNTNEKVSFAFLIAPCIVSDTGEQTSTENENSVMTWEVASGLLLVDGVYIENPEPTGCAAYTGPGELDKPGDWRLPTQRELQMMFTVVEQAIELLSSGVVDGEAATGTYWTSTEFSSAYEMTSADLEYIDTADQVWTVNNFTGETAHPGPTAYAMIRCVKDIYETINEQ
ncbi:MAG: hypothetical protein SNG38_07435 [Rikenellaceae bacterium]